MPPEHIDQCSAYVEHLSNFGTNAVLKRRLWHETAVTMVGTLKSFEVRASATTLPNEAELGWIADRRCDQSTG